MQLVEEAQPTPAPAVADTPASAPEEAVVVEQGNEKSPNSEDSSPDAVESSSAPEVVDAESESSAAVPKENDETEH